MVDHGLPGAGSAAVSLLLGGSAGSGGSGTGGGGAGTGAGCEGGAAPAPTAAPDDAEEPLLYGAASCYVCKRRCV